MTMSGDAPAPDVTIRCSVAVWGPNRDSLLLVRRDGRPSSYALPGGTPEPGEGLVACARREVVEETGLQVMPTRCLLLAESLDNQGRLCLDVVLDADGRHASGEVQAGENHLRPVWVGVRDLGGIALVPPIAGHLRGLARSAVPDSIPLMGNLWRPHLQRSTGDSILDNGSPAPQDELTSR
jgi:8-oxo-dGTP diphosphatase